MPRSRRESCVRRPLSDFYRYGVEDEICAPRNPSLAQVGRLLCRQGESAMTTSQQVASSESAAGDTVYNQIEAAVGSSASSLAQLRGHHHRLSSTWRTPAIAACQAYPRELSPGTRHARRLEDPERDCRETRKRPARPRALDTSPVHTATPGTDKVLPTVGQESAPIHSRPPWPAIAASASPQGEYGVIATCSRDKTRSARCRNARRSIP